MSILTKLHVEVDRVYCDDRGYSVVLDWDTLHMMHDNEETKKVLYVGNYMMEDDYAWYACFNVLSRDPRQKRALHVAVKI